MPEDRGKYFIFIGGAPRSGTTLVQNMLDSHPDILAGPEFMHLPDIIQLRKILLHSIKEGRIDKYCSHRDVDQQICLLIENLLLPLKQKHGKKIISEKTPGNVNVFTDLIELFPESKFLHVVRDPRAIVASMLQVGKRAKKIKGLKLHEFTRSTSAAINYIKKCFANGFDAAQHSSDGVMTILYEKLVNDPVSETKRICDFLKVEWSSKMLTPQNKKHMGEESITKSTVWYNKSSFNRAPETGEIKKWASQLNIIQKAVIFLAFRNDTKLSSLGYSLSFDDLRRTEKIFYPIVGAFGHVIYFISRISNNLIRTIFYLLNSKIPSIRS